MTEKKPAAAVQTVEGDGEKGTKTRKTVPMDASIMAARSTLAKDEELMLYKGVSPQGLILSLVREGKSTTLRTGMKPQECVAFLDGFTVGRQMR